MYLRSSFLIFILVLIGLIDRNRCAHFYRKIIRVVISRAIGMIDHSTYPAAKNDIAPHAARSPRDSASDAIWLAIFLAFDHDIFC